MTSFKIPFFGLLFVPVCILIGCAYATNTMRASRYIQRGNPDHAIKILSKEITDNRADYLTYYYLGKAYYVKGEYDSALPYFNKSIERNSSYFFSQINRGSLCSNMNNYDLALESFNNAILLDHLSHDAFYLRGLLYQINEKYDEALADYNIALGILPNNMRTLVQKATLLCDMKHYNSATALFEFALRLFPNEPKVLDEYAWSLITSNDMNYKNPNKALKLATKAVEIFPCAVTYDTLAAVNASLNKFNHAVVYQMEAIKQLDNMKPKNPLLNNYRFHLKERLKAYENQELWDQSMDVRRRISVDP